MEIRISAESGISRNSSRGWGEYSFHKQPKSNYPVTREYSANCYLSVLDIYYFGT